MLQVLVYGDSLSWGIIPNTPSAIAPAVEANAIGERLRELMSQH
jgi:hypothetical protein